MNQQRSVPIRLQTPTNQQQRSVPIRLQTPTNQQQRSVPIHLLKHPKSTHLWSLFECTYHTDCRPDQYCGSTSLTCKDKKLNNESCMRDYHCVSGECSWFRGAGTCQPKCGEVMGRCGGYCAWDPLGLLSSADECEPHECQRPGDPLSGACAKNWLPGYCSTTCAGGTLSDATVGRAVRAYWGNIQKTAQDAACAGGEFISIQSLLEVLEVDGMQQHVGQGLLCADGPWENLPREQQVTQCQNLVLLGQNAFNLFARKERGDPKAVEAWDTINGLLESVAPDMADTISSNETNLRLALSQESYIHHFLNFAFAACSAGSY